MIQDYILEECPIPDHSLLKPAKLDSDMIELLPMVARTPTHQIFWLSPSTVQTARWTNSLGWSSKVEMEHNRRLNLLSHFMRDPKKASDLLKSNEGSRKDQMGVQICLGHFLQSLV